MAFGDLRGSVSITGANTGTSNDLTGSVSNVAVGDLITGVFSEQTSLTATGTVTDNLGNTYAFVSAGIDSGTITGRAFYAYVTTGGTLTTVTVPASSSNDDFSAVASVFEGPFKVSPLDKVGAWATDADTPFTCPASGTLTQANEMVVGYVSIAGNQTVAATSPSIISGTANRNNSSSGLSKRVVSATTTVSPQFSGTSANASVGTATFMADTTQDIAPGLYTDSDTFYSPSFTLGSVDISASLFSDGDTFYSPTIEAAAASLPSQQNIIFELEDEEPEQIFGAIELVFEVAEQDIAPSLFTDTDTFYSPSVSLESAQNISPALFSDADAFYSPSVSLEADQDISPSLFTDGDAFYSPNVALVGVQDIAPSLFSDADTFYSPTFTLDVVIIQQCIVLYNKTYEEDEPEFIVQLPAAESGTGLDIAPSLFSDSDTFYSPSFTFGAVDIAPGFFSDAVDTFYSPTVVSGLSIDPSLFVDIDTLYSPSFTLGAVDIAPSLFTDGDTFFAPSVALEGAQNVSLALFTDADTFYTPSVALEAAQDIAPALLADGDTFYAPDVSLQAAQDIAPSLFTDADTFYSPSVNLEGFQGIVPALFIDSDVFYSPTVAPGVVNRSPALFTDADTLYAPSVSLQAPQNVTPSLFTDADTFYAPALASVFNVGPALFTDADTFYVPAVGFGIAPSLFVDTDAFYSPSFTLGAVDRSPALFVDDDEFYSPTISGGGINLSDVFMNDQIFYDTSVEGHPRSATLGRRTINDISRRFRSRPRLIVTATRPEQVINLRRK